MQRVTRSNAVATLPSRPVTEGAPGFFAKPNPAGGIDATVPGYEFFNMIQEEIVAFILDAGLSLDASSYTQMRDAARLKTKFRVATAAGTANAITATFDPVTPTALTGNPTWLVRINAANSSTTPTFQADAAATKTIVKGNNLPLALGDLPGAGYWAFISYDSGLDKVVLHNPATGIVTGAAPVGVVMHFPTTTAPAGYLKANGAAVSRTTYASLFSVIGTSYGAGDGSTTFNVPDLRGLFLRGYHDGSGTYETDTSRAVGSFQADSLQNHSHSTANYVNGGPSPIGDGSSIASLGSGETRGRNMALLAVIKY